MTQVYIKYMAPKYEGYTYISQINEVSVSQFGSPCVGKLESLDDPVIHQSGFIYCGI